MGIKVERPPKPSSKSNLKESVTGIFTIAKEEDLITLTGMKRGDLCFQNNSDKLFMYDGDKWVPAAFSESPKQELTYRDITCPSCGSHSFIRTNSEFIKCEYCGSSVYFPRNISGW